MGRALIVAAPEMNPEAEEDPLIRGRMLHTLLSHLGFISGSVWSLPVGQTL